MKKKFLISALIIMSNHFCATQKIIIHLPESVKTPTLSELQKFQLYYLKTELTKNATQVQTAWIDNVNVLILIETAELLIASSDAATQPLIKAQIIQIFQDIDINIKITSDNLIEKVAQKKTPITVTLKQKKSKNKEPEPYQPPKLKRIRGANRTLRQIKERYKEKPIDQHPTLEELQNTIRIVSANTEIEQQKDEKKLATDSSAPVEVIP